MLLDRYLHVFAQHSEHRKKLVHTQKNPIEIINEKAFPSHFN